MLLKDASDSFDHARSKTLIVFGLNHLYGGESCRRPGHAPRPLDRIALEVSSRPVTEDDKRARLRLGCGE